MTDDKPDPIGALMHDLRTRGRARLIAGTLDEVVEDVWVQVHHQVDLWDPNVIHEELVVTLDTLETILRWNADRAKGLRIERVTAAETLADEIGNGG